MHFKRFLLPLSLLVAACGATPVKEAAPKAPAVVVLDAAPASPKGAQTSLADASPPDEAPGSVPEAERIDTSGRALPEGFVLDGDVSEWGVLAEPPDPEIDEATKQKGAPIAPAPNRLSIVFEPTRVVIAGELTGALAKGVYVALRFENNELPPVGMYQRGGGVREFQCEINESTGEELSGVERESCEAMLAGIAQFRADYAARFTRVYRVDQGGVRSAAAGGLSPIAGAEASFKGEGGKATFEMSLPLSALPRCAESPVTFAYLAALPGSADRPVVDVPEQRFVRTISPAGASFEPDGEMRNAAFWVQNTSPWYAYRPALSYQPGEANRIETVVYPGSFDMGSLSLEPVSLYSIAYHKGDVEVIFLQGGRLVAMQRRAGKLSEAPIEMGAQPDVVVTRGKDLHVLAASSYTATDTWTESAEFEAVAIHPDGSQEPVEIRTPQEVSMTPFSKVNVVHDATWSTFGFVGQTREDGADDPSPAPKQISVSYTWSPREKAYLGRVR